MRDLIDERNFREKCRKSIVKGYNVHYVTQEELKMQQEAGEQEELLLQEDPMAAEETELFSQQGENDRDTADLQGDVTQEQIEKILGERQENIQKTIEASKG